MARSRHVEELQCSPIYETSPVGGPARQRTFLNAVITGRTKLPALALLHLLRKSESATGRSEDPEARTGPRTLDLDLLLYGDQRIETEELTVPHPRMTERLFVLVPLADLAPRRVVPGTGKRVARLLAEARRVSTEDVRPWRPAARPSPRTARGRRSPASSR